MIKLHLTLVLLSIISLNLYANQLPNLGSPDLIKYDPQTEIKLGKAFLTELHTNHPIVSDPEILNYVRQIGHHIASQTGQKRHFRFYVIDNSEINAFAGPNGIIGIYTGLIMAAKTEDELAAVIAHEIAHVTQNHLSRRFHYHQSLNINSIASLIAAVLIGTQDPAAGMAALMGGMGLNIQQQLKNSRIHENEADYFGIKYLHKAGYNPFAMRDFFGKLSKKSQLNEFNLPEILRTHPVTENRLAKAYDRAEFFPAFKPQENNSISLDLIKKRVHLLSQTTNQSQFIKLIDISRHITCYEKNLNALVQQEFANFDLPCLEKASHDFPQERLFKLLKNQIIGINSPNKAHKNFNYLNEIFPRDSAIILRHSEMWRQHQQIAKAIQILSNSPTNYKYSYLLYQTTAELYTIQNKLEYSYYYGALASLNIGNTKYAKHLLEKSLLLAKNNNPLLTKKINFLVAELSQDIEIKNKKDNNNKQASIHP